MGERLLAIKMHDGSRHFAELPETVSWHELRRHVERLRGATVTNFLTDNVTEVWIDFSFRGHEFGINNQFGSYWFFVRDWSCPEEILEAVVTHCKLLFDAGRFGSHSNGEDS
jgi:hypothetical protein